VGWAVTRSGGLNGLDGDGVAELGQAGDEFVLVTFGVLASGVEVLAELVVGLVAVEDAVDE